MTRRMIALLLLCTAACGGPGAASPKDTATTPDAAVRMFMQAVADSNIIRMGRYWGTQRGPSGETHQPADYEQRLVVMQSYLRNSPYKVVREDPVQGDSKRFTVQVALDRTDADGATCVRTVPVTVVNTGSPGWIVSSVDLLQAGTPGRACGRPKPPGN